MDKLKGKKKEDKGEKEEEEVEDKKELEEEASACSSALPAQGKCTASPSLLLSTPAECQHQLGV